MKNRKQKNQRIEPTFGPVKRRAAADLRATEADRTLARSKNRPSRNSEKPQPRKKRKTGRSRSGLFGVTGKLIYWSLVLSLWTGIAAAGVLGYYAATLPHSSGWSIPQRPPNARIVSTDGGLMANRGASGGAAMPINQMSPYIPMAVVAIEDRRFESHFGFDPIGFTRAMVTNVIEGKLVQGGSTLTQQLAKNLFLKPERTIERKIQELLLAFWLEAKFSKNEILELYLNRVYFGSGAYGVDAASRRYFNKSARDVNLAEAALLAGLLKAPSRLSPAKNPKLAEDRAQVVLLAMQRSNFISDREATTALTMPAAKAKRYWSGSEHYVADLIMKEIPTLIGEMNTDIIVDTTINMSLQKTAGEIIANTLDEHGKKRSVSQGAMVAMEPDGAIRALVGGREYADSQFNRVTDALRQPGSAFKSIVYLAALEAGRTPESIRQDAPVRIGNWKPVNYDRKYRGPVTLDTALSKSLNTVAAQLVMEIGPPAVVDTAYRLGIRSELKENASIALGTSEVNLLELTAAYAPFANGGYSTTPYLVRRITDVDGNVLYEREGYEPVRVIRSRELGMMNHMLRSVIHSGTGRAAALGQRDAAGKTGTSQESRDGLFVGYTSNLVTGFWYGNDDNSPTAKVTGGSLPAQSWKTFMESAHENIPFASLPGNYSNVASVIPAARHGANISQQYPNQEAGIEPQRRPLSEIDGVRPPAPLGSGPSNSKSILELIFGG